MWVSASQPLLYRGRASIQQIQILNYTGRAGGGGGMVCFMWRCLVNLLCWSNGRGPLTKPKLDHHGSKSHCENMDQGRGQSRKCLKRILGSGLNCEPPPVSRDGTSSYTATQHTLFFPLGICEGAGGREGAYEGDKCEKRDGRSRSRRRGTTGMAIGGEEELCVPKLCAVA